ncbi:MAG: hypothetical protein E4H20_09205 [Spirochaetales bacterium]|nr:MAG: hypothetical protein E4H20_09205 [Spirochaetales bacterium]
MKFDAVQLMRVAEEILKYFYMKGARHVAISYDFGKERSFCGAHSRDLVLEERDMDYLRHVFDGPVQPEIANYYGTLAGRRRDELEMELVGTMVELDELVSESGLGTRMLVSRREMEYRSSLHHD